MYQNLLTPFWKSLEYSLGVASSEEGTAEWHVEQGIKRGKQGYYIEAIEEFDKSISLGLTLALVYSNRGVAYASLRRFHEAIEDYNKAIGLNPEFAEVYINRAVVYTELGKQTEAIADLKKFINWTENPQWIEWVERTISELSK